MRGSLAEVDLIQWERAVSMILTKRDGGSRVTLLLSSLSEGRRSGHRERVSGPASNLPETWIIFRSKSPRSMSHHAWQWLSA